MWRTEKTSRQRTSSGRAASHLPVGGVRRIGFWATTGVLAPHSLSGLTTEEIELMADLVARFAVGEEIRAPAAAAYRPPMLIRYLVDDLKAFY